MLRLPPHAIGRPRAAGSFYCRDRPQGLPDMALPALPPSNTTRLKVDYNVGPDNHSFIVRLTDGVPNAIIQARIMAVLSALSPMTFASVCTGTSIAAVGSNVFLPFDVGLTGDTWGALTPSGQQRTWFLSVAGRSTVTGRRNLVKLFCVKTNGDASYRYNRGENSQMDALLNAFDATEPGIWLAIDGAATAWNEYVNIKQDDHMVKKLRGGG